MKKRKTLSIVIALVTVISFLQCTSTPKEKVGLPNGNCRAGSAIKVTFEKWKEKILVRSLKRTLLS